MDFISSIADAIGIKDFIGANNFTATITESVGYFFNVREIKNFSEDEITLVYKGGEAVVRGKNLYVKKFCAGDVAICGKITALEKK